MHIPSTPDKRLNDFCLVLNRKNNVFNPNVLKLKINK